MSYTVGQICAHNAHAGQLNETFLRPKSEIITPLERKVHAVFQGGFYGGWNASTLAELVKNPIYYGIGAGAGAGAGAIFRFFKHNVSSSEVNYIQNWKDWLEHPVVMNKITKLAGSALHIIGISGNTAAGFLVDSKFMSLVEGFAVGTQVGYEGSGLLLHLIAPVDPANGTTAEEKQPIV